MSVYLVLGSLYHPVLFSLTLFLQPSILALSIYLINVWQVNKISKYSDAVSEVLAVQGSSVIVLK